MLICVKICVHLDPVPGKIVLSHLIAVVHRGVFVLRIYLSLTGRQALIILKFRFASSVSDNASGWQFVFG